MMKTTIGLVVSGLVYRLVINRVDVAVPLSSTDGIRTYTPVNLPKASHAVAETTDLVGFKTPAPFSFFLFSVLPANARRLPWSQAKNV